MTPAERLIVALDTADLRGALRVTQRLRGLIRYVKIGSALFTAEGPEAIRQMRARGLEVFLDVKFYDIPSTVEKSCRAAVRHRVAMLTVHAAGGLAMLEAAAFGVRQEAKRLGIVRPRVVGVTVLTSDEAASATTATVLRLAEQARRAALDGVVASAHEVAALRKRFGPSWRVVCPGIRLEGAAAADQRRIASPKEAIARGADVLVVGRPITEADDPAQAVTHLLTQIQEGMAHRC